MARATLGARFMGPTWGPSGSGRTQVGPMLAPWTLLSGKLLYPLFRLAHWSVWLWSSSVHEDRANYLSLILNQTWSVHLNMRDGCLLHWTANKFDNWESKNNADNLYWWKLFPGFRYFAAFRSVRSMNFVWDMSWNKSYIKYVLYIIYRMRRIRDLYMN